MALQLDFSKSQARGRAVEDNFMTFIFQSAFNKNIDIHEHGKRGDLKENEAQIKTWNLEARA